MIRISHISRGKPFSDYDQLCFAFSWKNFIILEILLFWKFLTFVRNADSGVSVSCEVTQSTASTAPSDRLMATEVTLINKKHRQGKAY